MTYTERQFESEDDHGKLLILFRLASKQQEVCQNRLQSCLLAREKTKEKVNDLANGQEINKSKLMTLAGGSVGSGLIIGHFLDKFISWLTK